MACATLSSAASPGRMSWSPEFGQEVKLGFS
jgi:hypothetical protein